MTFDHGLIREDDSDYVFVSCKRMSTRKLTCSRDNLTTGIHSRPLRPYKRLLFYGLHKPDGGYPL